VGYQRNSPRARSLSNNPLFAWAAFLASLATIVSAFVVLPIRLPFADPPAGPLIPSAHYPATEGRSGTEAPGPASASAAAPASGTAIALGNGWGVDLDKGSVGQAFTMPGADISVGPGTDGDELDVGDGAAIYVLSAAPGRPEDCSAGRAAQSVPLPVTSGLCVLTGQGNLATLRVTGSSATRLTFTYRLWSQ
jgi:hypothetical protein